jgi:regulator of protease activity HflC (stomatin/prohibitin superfamily)
MNTVITIPILGTVIVPIAVLSVEIIKQNKQGVLFRFGRVGDCGNRRSG